MTGPRCSTTWPPRQGSCLLAKGSLRHQPRHLNRTLSFLLQLQHVRHAARRQGQHQAAREQLQDFRQWLDAAVQQLAAEQAQLAAELAEDVQQARQQEDIAPAEEQTLEGVS